MRYIRQNYFIKQLNIKIRKLQGVRGTASPKKIKHLSLKKTDFYNQLTDFFHFNSFVTYDK